MFILLSFVSQGAIIVTDWWLSRWSDSFTELVQNGTNITNISVLDRRSIFGLTNRMTIIIYSCLLLATWILTAGRCIATVKIAVDSAKTFHNRMLKSIMAAPIYFFDTNPVGNWSLDCFLLLDVTRYLDEINILYCLMLAYYFPFLRSRVE